MDVSKLYERAEAAIERNNLEYAIDLFQEILVVEPDFVKARRALRAVEKRWLQQKGGAGKLTAFLQGIPSLVKAFIFKQLKQYEKAMVECERFLAKNPSNTSVLRWLAESATEAGYVDSAIVCYEAILEFDPRNVTALKSLGRLYAARNEVNKALQYYEEVKRLNPADAEADRAVRDLAALGTIKKGWEQAKGYRDVIKDEKEAKKLEESEKILRTMDDVEKAISRLKEELQQDDSNTLLWIQLGDLLTRKKDFSAAKEAYEKAKQLDPSNPSIRARFGDLEIHRRRAEIEEMQKALKAAESTEEKEGLQKKIEDKKRALQEFLIEEFAKRVAEHPTDLGLRVEYGKHLFGGGRMDEAIAEFQKAVDSPKYRKECINYMGRAFMKKGMFDLAVDQFEKAAGDITVMDEAAKEVFYNLGTAHEKLGNLEKAMECYKKIYEVDIGFRDVSTKIENIYNRRKQDASNEVGKEETAPE